MHDKAGTNYWDHAWEAVELPKAMRPHSTDIRHFREYAFDQLLKKVLQAPYEGKKLLEIGCGGSVWLPYFAREFGYQVSGIDYSEKGIGLSHRILEREGLNAEIVFGDMFQPPDNLLGRFDVIFSSGVAEHFSDTTVCIRAMSQFLAPGGQIVTSIPNLRGLNGTLQRVMDRSVYDVHIPLSREELHIAHEQAGLEVEFCDYFLFLNLSAVNVEAHADKLWAKAFKKTRSACNYLLWFFERHLPLKANRMTSPYTVCVARKV